MTHSEQINVLAAALSKAQGALAPAIKGSVNPAYRSKYADLAANVEAAREPLAANGLAVVQEAVLRRDGDGGYVGVTTRILHASGQWIEFGPLNVPLAKIDAHGVGSATSYARRYGLGAALGLVADDDDGNGAVGHAKADPVAVEAPAGFAKWWKDLESAAGVSADALADTWKAPAAALRQYVNASKRAEWEQLKAKAANGAK